MQSEIIIQQHDEPLSDYPEHKPRGRNRPYGTIALVTAIWAFYLWGISKIGWTDAHYSLSSPLSPPFKSFWFLAVDEWPSCRDLRPQSWRLFSVQVTHAGLCHIGGNTIGLLTYGAIIERYYCMNSVGILIVFQICVLLGCLANYFLFPFEALVGCSAGVYGLIGLSVSQLVMDYECMDDEIVWIGSYVLVIQLIADIMGFLLMNDPSTAYLSHVVGYCSGMCLGFVSYSWKPQRWRTSLAIVAVMALLLINVYFGYNYSNIWPPRAHRSKLSRSDSLSCCAQYFSFDSQYPNSVAKEDFQCS